MLPCKGFVGRVHDTLFIILSIHYQTCVGHMSTSMQEAHDGCT